MTRINVGIKPFFLSDEHLLAEHREIRRLCYYYYNRVLKNKYDGIPPEFCLGTGHILFFMDKPEYTLNRYNLIYNECIKRGFNMTNYSSNWDIWKKLPTITTKYTPSFKDSNIILHRIISKVRVSPKPYFHYYHNRISKEILIYLMECLIT